jgi:hypothetical protein
MVRSAVLAEGESAVLILYPPLQSEIDLLKNLHRECIQ